MQETLRVLPKERRRGGGGGGGGSSVEVCKVTREHAKLSFDVDGRRGMIL